MAIIIYGHFISAPCRSVFMLCKDMNLKYEFREIDVLNNKQLEPEFLKINPQHTIPTLEDNGKIIWESHAIMMYLVSKYGTQAQQKRLYSRNVYARGVIDQMLLFDTGVLFPTVRRIVVNINCDF